jgi:hypothetical protein
MSYFGGALFAGIGGTKGANIPRPPFEAFYLRNSFSGSGTPCQQSTGTKHSSCLSRKQIDPKRMEKHTQEPEGISLVPQSKDEDHRFWTE